MTAYRDKGRVSYKSISDTGKQIRSIMAISGHNTAPSHFNIVGHDISENLMHDDEDEDEGGDCGTQLDAVTSYVFNPKSRAEETIEREQREKHRLGLLPEAWTQKFHTGVNGNKYPYHPDSSNRHSQYAVDFWDCFCKI